MKTRRFSCKMTSRTKWSGLHYWSGGGDEHPLLLLLLSPSLPSSLSPPRLFRPCHVIRPTFLSSRLPDITLIGKRQCSSYLSISFSFFDCFSHEHSLCRLFFSFFSNLITYILTEPITRTKKTKHVICWTTFWE